MTLTVSAKVQMAQSNQASATGMRQIELWANAVRWNPISLATNWAYYAGSDSNTSPPQYLIDPFNWIHFRGQAQYTGNINTIAYPTTGGSGVLYGTITGQTLPTYDELYVVPSSAGLSYVQVLSNGQIYFCNVSGLLVTNPIVTLSGFVVPTSR